MESKDLLQVNATVIAGLLILLTLQTSVEILPLSEQNEWRNKIWELEVEQYALQKTLSDLREKITNNEETKSDSLQTHIADIETRLMETNHTLEKMKNTQFKIIDEKGNVITIEEELQKPSFTKTVQTYGIVMIVPFAASSAVLLGIELQKEEEKTKRQKALKTAKVMTLLGFMFILVALVVFNYFIQFR